MTTENQTDINALKVRVYDLSVVHEQYAAMCAQLQAQMAELNKQIQTLQNQKEDEKPKSKSKK